jgi:hypothetical protein
MVMARPPSAEPETLSRSRTFTFTFLFPTDTHCHQSPSPTISHWVPRRSYTVSSVLDVSWHQAAHGVAHPRPRDTLDTNSIARSLQPFSQIFNFPDSSMTLIESTRFIPVRWPSGLRRQLKVIPFMVHPNIRWSERAWVQIPLSSTLSFALPLLWRN